MHYFGRWDDPDGALQKFEEQKADLLAGRQPTEQLAGLAIFDLCAKFLTTKKQARDAGELSIHSFKDYGDACNRLIKAVGPQSTGCQTWGRTISKRSASR